MNKFVLMLAFLGAAVTACGKSGSSPDKPAAAPAAASKTPEAKTPEVSRPAGETAPAPKTAEQAIVGDAVIVAHGADMKCTPHFLEVYGPLVARIRANIGRLEKAMDKMQKLHDDNELTGDAQGVVMNEFTTLRSATTEMKLTFGRNFGCNDKGHGSVTGDAHFAKFNEIRTRLGRLVGTHLIGDEIN